VRSPLVDPPASAYRGSRVRTEENEETTGGNQCPKIVLEGTRPTHTTDIAFTLNKCLQIVGPPAYRYHSSRVSVE
jgi:hypothetical protein